MDGERQNIDDGNVRLEKAGWSTPGRGCAIRRLTISGRRETGMKPRKNAPPPRARLKASRKTTQPKAVAQKPAEKTRYLKAKKAATKPPAPSRKRA